jgi:uncharacterized membrane protein YphA (DoxX/SURF4 family)
MNVPEFNNQTGNAPMKYYTGYRFWVTVVAGIILGLVFLSAAIGKLLDISAFIFSVKSLILYPYFLQSLITNLLPWAEIILGLLLITGIAPRPVSILSGALVIGFIFQNSWLILHGFSNEPCTCLGVIQVIIQGKLSTMNALYIDIGMVILCLIIYFVFQGEFLEWRPWFLRLKRS